MRSRLSVGCGRAAGLMYGSGVMGNKQSGSSFKRSAESLQDNVRRAGPAAGASYTLIGAIILLGGIGYVVDQWRATAPWGLFVGLLLGLIVGFYELVKSRLASMKPVAWMAGASLISWLVMRATSPKGREIQRSVRDGRAAGRRGGSWLAYERAHRSAPGRLTNVMIAALALKMVFFGVYVVVMLRGLDLRPVPFVVSFAAYFIALHAMEALFLRRLLMNDLRSPSGERA